MSLRVASWFGLLLLPIFTVAGGTITLSATTSGWYQSDATASGPLNQNYVAGRLGPGLPEVRDFFVFDLTSVTQPIVSAQLQAYNPSMSVTGDIDNGYSSPNASDTFDLFDVSTAIATLSAGTGGLAAFNDLGGGTIYGTHTFVTADNGTIVSISVDAAAITALNSSHTLFAFGGANVTLVSGRDDMFGFTAGPLGGAPVSNTTRQLVLQTANVPKPSTLRLIGICGAILFLLQRRRRLCRGSAIHSQESLL